jgi:hypothetical protein
METERDALVPKARALPTPTVVHWGHIQKYLNPILAIAIPAVFLSFAVSNANDKNSQNRTTGSFRVKFLTEVAIGLFFSLIIAWFPVRHTFAIEGDKITYVRYRFFGLNLFPLVRVFTRQVGCGARPQAALQCCQRSLSILLSASIGVDISYRRY